MTNSKLGTETGTLAIRWFHAVVRSICFAVEIRVRECGAWCTWTGNAGTASVHARHDADGGRDGGGHPAGSHGCVDVDADGGRHGMCAHDDERAHVRQPPSA